MKSSQAAELRERWSQIVHPLHCDHLNQEMEQTAGGYLTGIYHCVVCGESIAHP